MFRNEYAYRQNLCKRFKEDGCRVQPIESGGTGAGVPDLFVRSKYRHLEFWMELKNFVTPDSGNVKVPFRPGQLAWLTMWSDAGAACVIGLSTQWGEAYFSGNDIRGWYPLQELIERSNPVQNVTVICNIAKRAVTR